MTATTHQYDRAPIELPKRTRLEILAAVLLGIFLAALDQTVVGTALPVIVAELRGNDAYTWAFTAYLLTATVSGPIYGSLSDLLGRRPIVILGVGIFLAGSLLCGLSQNMAMFISFRGLQGLGAGALFPMALAIIADIFAPSERGKYQGLFGAVFGVSSLVGPAIGGILTDTVGWHWIFYVNVPLGALVLFIIWRTLPRHRVGGADRHIDYVGAALLVATLVPILIGITNKQSAEWFDPQVGGLIGLGLLLGAAFVWVESRVRAPIVPLSLFRIRAFVASVSAMFLAATAFFAAIVFLPRWYQVVAGASATESGYQILPLLLGVVSSAVVSGQVVARTGRYKALIVSALVVMAVGLLMLTGIRPDTPRPLLWLWMAVTGLGIGPSFAVFPLAVQNSVPVRQLGSATSSLTLFEQVGGAVGLAITGSIFSATFLAEVPPRLDAAGVPEQLAGRLTGGSALNDVGGVGDLDVSILAQVPEQLRPQVEPIIPTIVDAIHAAFSIATGSTFAVGIFAALIAAALVLIVMPARRMGRGKPSMVPFRSRLSGSSSGRRSREHTATGLDFAVAASSRLRSSRQLRTGGTTMDTANVRYLVDDVPVAVDFYTKQLEFTVEFDAPAIAAVTRGSLRLLLSGPTSSGARAMPDGRRPEPGGWNRVQIIVDDLEREVARLRAAGVRFRNDIVTGPGGRQTLLEDPAGNPLELFTPADREG